MDRVPPEVRSRIMSRIRSRDTGPEMEVRRALHRAGYRYRLHSGDLPGRPDLVFRGRKVAVFVNGCFWHRCPWCRPGVPKSNSGFWGRKFRRNVDRDREAVLVLESMGWRAVTVWECRIADGLDELMSVLGEADE